MAERPSPLEPSPADLRILQVLVEHAGRVCSRDTLMRKAGLESTTPRRADVSIVILRRALGKDSVRTVRQRGWILTDSGLISAKKLLGLQVDIRP